MFHKGCYSDPREDNASFYREFEIGYVNRHIPQFEPFEREGETDIFPYVPIEVIENVIKQAGGFIGYVKKRNGT